MTEGARDACITGIGIVSCLGEGPEAHWQKLVAGEINVDEKTYAPFLVHPIAALELDKQIPKKGDQRQMEMWQRIGVYAAGLALEAAAIKGNNEILARTDMIVAAGGGERDLAADSAILSALPAAANPDALLNEKLMSDIRPTLFLAQLSNLLAGNISIVHNVTGSSRTFMGEEACGVDAVRTAVARINAGQSDIVLVGGSYNGERKDNLLLYEFGHALQRGAFKPVWERGPDGGMAFGSLGAFLVVESRSHALKRGAKVLAKIVSVLSDRARSTDSAADVLGRMWSKIAGRLRNGESAIISGATGVGSRTSAERIFLSGHKDLPVRATGTHIGHGLEAQFPMNLAIAALALGRGKLFPPRDGSGFERAMDGRLTQVVVTSVGARRGEGLALVEAA
ncbi:MAG: beta-ketoacyl-ACP synthase [Pseudolabrys sp.]|nr:beta-ketoacyl-ACP synthase [Pseudolabrys sp.]